MTEQSFTSMMETYGRLVYTVCYQFVKDASLAEDLTQETFLSAWTHLDSCPANAEKPWLCRIATNKAKDYLKSAYHRRMAVTEDPAATTAAHAAACLAPSPEDIYVAQESASLTHSTIQSLAEPYRAVSILYFLEELPVETIAAALGRAPKTVYTQLYRAKKILRQNLMCAAG